jgi:hypothetical protein
MLSRATSRIVLTSSIITTHPSRIACTNAESISRTVPASSAAGTNSCRNKDAASSDFSRFGRHPSGRPTRTTLLTVAGSDRAVGCTEPTIAGSPGVTAARWRDYRNRGIAMARPERAREPKQSCRAQATHAWIWAGAAVGLWFRSLLLP